MPRCTHLGFHFSPIGISYLDDKGSTLLEMRCKYAICMYPTTTHLIFYGLPTEIS